MKKAIKTLVAGILVVGLMTGCGKTNVEEKESSSATSSATSSVASSAIESSEVVENKYPDYLNLEGHRPIVAEGEKITLTMTVANGTRTTQPEDRWFYKFIEEVLNIDLEVDGNWNAERKNVILNSADLPDVIWTGGITPSEIVKYGQEGGLFLDLSQYINEELTPNIVAAMEKYPDAFKQCVSPDGAMYTLPKINYSPSQQGTQRCYVDPAYLEAIGITSEDELPTTLEGFIDMLRAFKKLDPASMGVDEIIPLAVSGSMGGYDSLWLMQTFGWVPAIMSYQASPTWDEAEQQVVIPCLQDKFKDFVKCYHTLYSEGLVDEDFVTMSSEQATAMISEGKVAVAMVPQIQPYQPERYTEWVYYPVPLTCEYNDKPIATYVDDGITKGDIVVSAETKYIEVIMRLLDYLYSAEGTLYNLQGPLDGSEDTLGCVSGVVLANGVPTNTEVLKGEVTNYTYRRNYVALDAGMNLNATDATILGDERLGLTAIKNEEEYTAKAKAASEDDPQIRAYDHFLKTNPYKVYALKDPFVTVEQAERLTDLTTVMENYVDAEMAKFVVGDRPIDELDDFMKELQALDGQELWDLAQDVYKR